MRETLFNWLATDIPGARVLDCFSGAGGLGFEAASREAREVIMVDKDREIIQRLGANAERLQADNIELQQRDIMDYLEQARRCFDVVFIDPPYADKALRSLTLQQLIERDLLCPGARIYLEWPSAEDMPLVDARLHWVRQKTAGQVTYALAQWQ